MNVMLTLERASDASDVYHPPFVSHRLTPPDRVVGQERDREQPLFAESRSDPCLEVPNFRPGEPYLSPSPVGAFLPIERLPV